MTRKKPMYEHGEYMHLNWDCDQDEEFVRGHVTPEEFAASFKAYHFGLDDPYRVPIPVVMHRYGRWSTENDMFEGSVRVLRVYDEPGAGRFPITVAPFADLNPRQHWIETPGQFCRRMSHHQVWDQAAGGFRCTVCKGWPEGRVPVAWVQDRASSVFPVPSTQAQPATQAQPSEETPHA